MEKPEDFPKALAVLQISDISLYCVVAVVVYRFAGAEVTSPAFGSAGILISKIAYGIAIPTVSYAAFCSRLFLILKLDSHCGCHLRARLVHLYLPTDRPAVTLTKDMEGMGSMGRHYTHSLGNCMDCCRKARFPSLSFTTSLIQRSIPVFNNLLALISSLFASWFTYGISGWFWLHINWGKCTSSKRKMLGSLASWGVVLIGCVSCFVGLYTSIYAIHQGYNKGASWSCSAPS
jgi:hypothetical protein